MMIKTFKKQKPRKHDDDIQKLIDSAGETQFTNIFTNLKDELKNIIITKLLKKLEEQTKLIEEYQKEILALKNDLTYILKRVLLLKNNSLITNQKTSNFSRIPLTCKNSKSNIFNNTENSSNSQKISEDNCVFNYMNSIYKNNFIPNNTNIGKKFLLGKNENLIDELFSIRENHRNKSINGINSKNNKDDERRNKSIQMRPYNSQRNIFIKTKSNKDTKKNKKFFTMSIMEPINDYNSVNTKEKEKFKNTETGKKNNRNKGKICEEKIKTTLQSNNFSSTGFSYGNDGEKIKGRKLSNITRPPVLNHKF